MLTRLIVLLALLVSAPVAANDPAPEPAAAPDAHAVVRGMTISCQTWGWEWATDEMVASMATLKELGVNWIAIHPYAPIRADGTVVVRDDVYADPTFLTRPIEEAHRLGLKIMIKPHIAYWGTKYGWRGEITYETEAEWTRFFETYTAWITRVAEATVGADAFVVGTELDGTIQHERAWRDVIAAVRAKTSVPLTYASNWDQYERVGFWDALDVIGIQGYFPLVRHDRVPEQAELDRAWTRLCTRLETFAWQHERKVLLAELGYNRSVVAARQPWEYRQGGEQAELVQRRCLDAALRAIDGSDVIVGAFLWKWFPGDEMKSNFIKSTPAMREVIAENWKGDPAAN